MHFHVQRKAVAGYVIDEPVTKQRPRAIQHWLVQFGDKAQQVVIRRAVGQAKVLDVVSRVVARCLAKARDASPEIGNQVERRRGQVSAIRVDDVADGAGSAGRLVEQQQGTDVRRARLRLHDEPHQVEWGNRLAHG
jgi:hypothetical protein